jgi:hypothetical protein
MPRDRENDAAWSRLLAEKKLDLASAQFPIPLKMTDLKKAGQREPRLMLSLDTRDKWPKPLRDHDVFPLGVSNTEILLLKGDAWFDFPAAKAAKREYRCRLPFQLVSSTIGQGENAHIMRLETSGFLKEFVGAKAYYRLRVASASRLRLKC